MVIPVFQVEKQEHRRITRTLVLESPAELFSICAINTHTRIYTQIYSHTVTNNTHWHTHMLTDIHIHFHMEISILTLTHSHTHIYTHTLHIHSHTYIYLHTYMYNHKHEDLKGKALCITLVGRKMT